MEIPKSRRKRNRSTSVCTSCHLKKKKCDRRNPCGTCHKAGRGSLCRYSTLNSKVPSPNGLPRFESETTSLETLPSTISSISLPDDNRDGKFSIIDFLTKSGDTRMPRMKGMLPHVSLVNSDPTTGLIRFLLKTSPPRMFEAVFWRDIFLSEEMALTFDNKWKSQPDIQYIPKLSSIHDNEEFNHLRWSVSQFGQHAGILFHLSISYILETLISQIQEVLPPADSITLFVEAFFAHDCAGFPIIDENSFKESLQRILGVNFQTRTSSISDIRIDSTDDLALLATLMFVMRFGYLGLISFPEYDSQHNEDVNVCKCCIPIDVINVGEHILKEISFTLEVRPSLLQAQAIRLLYHYHCPEGDSFTDDGEAGMFLGTIMLMMEALHLGDIENVLLDLAPAEWSAKLRESFLHSMILLDVELSVLYGRTPKYSLLSTQGTSNFSIVMPLVELLHHLTKSTLTPGLQIERLNLMADLAVLENLMLKILGKPEDFLNQDLDDNMKLAKFRLLIVSSCFILGVYYALYLHAESKMNYSASAYYFKQAARVILGDMVCINESFPRVCNTYFGTGALLKLRPLMLGCTRMKQVVCKLGYRAQCSFKLNQGIDRLKLITVKHILVEIEEGAARIYDELLEGSRCAWVQGKGYKFVKLALSWLDTVDVDLEPISQAVLKYGSSDMDLILRSLTKYRDDHRVYKEFHAVEIRGAAKSDEQEAMETIQADRMWNLVLMIALYIKELDFKRKIDKHDDVIKLPNGHDFDLFHNLLFM